ncbi:MAG: MATE family efflux transporter [Clostridia bacterium]|nr:MATE family efflux transporter [Clostridia bacterium]
MKIKSLIGDKAFYKMTFTVAVPIMLQNFITNLVNMLDNLMVGSVGTEQMSGVSVVNQLVFIFNLAVFGAISGVGIFTAQFYGKNDNDGIRYTLRYKLYICLVLFLIALGIFSFFGEDLISMFLHESDDGGDLVATMGYAKDYLQVILIGLLPFAIANAFAGTLRETGDTFTPMITGLIAVVINCVFNYLLIFGKFGFPEMGVRGAAAATVLSRYVECIILVTYAVAKRKTKFPYVRYILKSFSIPLELTVSVTKKAIPLFLNEVLWSTGMSMLSVAYSLHGLNVVAASSIANTVNNLFMIAFLSMGSSIGIIAGKLLGAGKHEEAVDTVKKLIAFSVALSIVMGVLLFTVGAMIPSLYQKTDLSARELAVYFIRVFALVMWIDSIANASYFTLRSGGKTFVTFLFDSGTLWALSVPAAFILYYAGLSIYWVFPIIQLIGIIKVIVGLTLVGKKVWVRTLI